MAGKIFTDNVVNLALESCLIRHIPAIMTTRKVDGLSVDELEALAAESEEVRKHRLDIQHEIEILEEGLKKCKRHKPRPLTGIQPVNIP